MANPSQPPRNGEQETPAPEQSGRLGLSRPTLALIGLAVLAAFLVLVLLP